jgi:streptogramin lyase
LWRSPVALAVAGAALIVVALVVFLMVRHGSRAALPGGSLVRIDATTNRVAAQVAVGNDPRAVAADANGVWVANHDGTVWRVDAHTGRVIARTPAYGIPADLAILPANIAACCRSSPGSAVVVNGPSDPSVVEINAASGATTVFRLPGRGPNATARPSTEADAPGVATGPSGIWVTRPHTQVARFNVTTGKLVQPLLISPRPDERRDSYFSGIAVGAGGVWIFGYLDHPTLWRIDPATGKLVATIPLPFTPTDVAVGDGAVWVTSALANWLARIDPATNHVTAEISAGKGAGAVAVGAGSVWVADELSGTIRRFDPRTLRVTGTINLDSRSGVSGTATSAAACPPDLQAQWFPVDLTVADGVVWVAARR